MSRPGISKTGTGSVLPAGKQYANGWLEAGVGGPLQGVYLVMAVQYMAFGHYRYLTQQTRFFISPLV